MKKRIAMLLAGTMVLTMLGACGASENESTDNSTEQVQKELQNKENDTQEDVSGEITVWTGSWNDGLMDEIMKDFYDQYPDVKVIFEYLPWDGMEDKYLSALQAGAGPDVLDMAIAWTIPYASMGKLQA